jgi:hypothetical protein
MTQNLACGSTTQQADDDREKTKCAFKIKFLPASTVLQDTIAKT